MSVGWIRFLCLLGLGIAVVEVVVEVVVDEGVEVDENEGAVCVALLMCVEISVGVIRLRGCFLGGGCCCC